MNYTFYHPALKPEHEAWRLRIREFSETEIRPVARHLDQTNSFSVELTRKMGALGLLGITIPQKYGGLGLDTLSYIIAVEEIARIDGSQAATIAAHNSLGIAPIYKYGNEEQRTRYLPMLTSGEYVWGFGLTEANAGSDANNTLTEAVPDGETWIINGSKIFITNSSSPMSAGVTIQAFTGEMNGKKELTAFLLDSNTPGYHREAITGKLMWRAADTGKLTFKNCRVPEANLLGKPGEGSKMMLETLDSGRLSIAAMGLGLAQGAFEMAFDYAHRRVQFGRTISKFQINSFKLADMALKAEHARSFLYTACWRKDQGLPFGKEAAMAKLYCSEIAREVADEAVQIHGAYGLTQDLDMERFYRDQRILQVGEGTSEILRLVIGRHLGIK